MMVPLLDEDYANTNDKEEKICLICMDPARNLIEEVNIIYNMPFLIKNCDCLCHIHYSCLEKWIKSNSVCPICRKAIISEQLLAENITTLYIEDNSQYQVQCQVQRSQVQRSQGQESQVQIPNGLQMNDIQLPNQQIVYVVPNKAVTCMQTLFLIVSFFVAISLLNYFLM